MIDVEDRVLEINETLQGLQLRDVVEVLANVLISQGIARMSVPGEISEITPENVVDLVMTDKQQNGESLPNALAHQGLVMLMWLRERKGK